MDSGSQNGVAGAVQQPAEHSHPDRADRDQPILDFPAREISGRDAAHADPYTYRGLQVADMRFVDVQRVVTEHHHGELQQRRQKPQVRVSNHRPVKDAVARHQAQLPGQIAQRIPSKLFLGMRGGHAGDSEAPGQSEHRAAQQNQSRTRLGAAVAFRHNSGSHGRADAADECAQLDDPVTPGKLVRRQ